MTIIDIHALTGPYLLDAVDDEERAGFELHLADCADCSTEVADLREAVTKLAASVALPPPAGLKSKVMTAVNQSRQLSPLLPAGPHYTRATEPASAARSATATVKAAAARGMRPRLGRRSLALAAAFVAIAGSGAIAVDQYRANTATTAVSARASMILTQPDARTVHGAVTGGGQATVVVSARQDAAVVLVRDLNPLPAHKTYQLWLVDAAQNARSIGLTDGESLRPTVVTGGVTTETAFAVTVEPDGGSTRPTLPATGGLQPVVQLNGPTA